MAFTPFEDVTAIKSVLDTDEYMSSIGFIPETIKKKSTNNEALDENSKFIFIYPARPLDKTKWLAEITYAIDIVANADEYGNVYNGARQIIALLQDRDIGNNHTLELELYPQEVSAPDPLVMHTMLFKTMILTHETPK